MTQRQQWNGNYRTLAAARRNLKTVQAYLTKLSASGTVAIETGTDDAGLSVYKIIRSY